jgi:hypothetical protein
MKEIRSYSCVAGHPIPPDLLDQLSQELTLDGGAVVRVCREHYAPIVVTVVKKEERRERRSSTPES